MHPAADASPTTTAATASGNVPTSLHRHLPPSHTISGPPPLHAGPASTRQAAVAGAPPAEDDEDERMRDASPAGPPPLPSSSSVTAPSAHGNTAAAATGTSATAAAGEDDINLEKHPSGIVPILQNIVATVNLGCKLQLKTIAMQARNAEYNPKRFAAVIMRIRDPKTTALIFASGKMVVTGAKSEELAKLASRKYARIVQKIGFDAKFSDFKIQNIVGSCDVKFPIRLESLAHKHGHFCSYEPELFPGLIYRMINPKVVLLIFVSGKIVLTGAKEREQIYEAFENMYPVLGEFKKITLT